MREARRAGDQAASSDAVNGTITTIAIVTQGIVKVSFELENAPEFTATWSVVISPRPTPVSTA